MTQDTIFLRNKGDIVGYAKYVSDPDTKLPVEVIHGGDLRSFAKRGEHLVSIYSVQIFSEFEEREYPYRFHSFEDIPVVLGELNKVDKDFKQIVAWDKNKMVPNTVHTLPGLGNKPREVSVDIVTSVQDILAHSPTKVRFSDVGELHLIPNVQSRSDSESSSDCETTKMLEKDFAAVPPVDKAMPGDIFEESVDQFVDELDLEEASRNERKAAAVERQMRELDESDEDVPITSIRGSASGSFAEGLVAERSDKAERHHEPRIQKATSLSPAERIKMKIRAKQAQRESSSRTGGASAPRSKSRRRGTASVHCFVGTSSQERPVDTSARGRLAGRPGGPGAVGTSSHGDLSRLEDDHRAIKTHINSQKDIW